MANVNQRADIGDVEQPPSVTYRCPIIKFVIPLLRLTKLCPCIGTQVDGHRKEKPGARLTDTARWELSAPAGVRSVAVGHGALSLIVDRVVVNQFGVGATGFACPSVRAIGAQPAEPAPEATMLSTNAPIPKPILPLNFDDLLVAMPA